MVGEIRNFNFYDQYLWMTEDFLNFQTWMTQKIEGLGQALGAAVVKGLEVTPNTGMQVNIAAGISVSPQGRLLYLDAATGAVLATPVGNPALSLVVLRANDQPADSIDFPTDPLTQVPLTNILQSQVVVLDGVPAGSPVYPTPASGDVVLMGFSLSAGQTTIVQSTLVAAQRNTWTKKEVRIQKPVSSYTVDLDDDVIWIPSGTFPLALPNVVAAANKRPVKVVNMGTGQITVNGTGLPTPVILDQYGSAEFLSDGLAWASFGGA